jgi:predicted TIM-barrel fold metal-dependent hydrolase
MLNTWAEKFPNIPSVIVHGLFPIEPFMKNGEVIFPKEFLHLFKHPNISAEVLFPVIAGPLGWDYPYPQAQRIIKHLYEEVGAEKLVWGSDMPLVECNCTYRQSLTYLKNYCDFIAPKDMDLIVGGNAVRILKIEAEVPNTVRSKLVGGIY